MAKLKKKKHHPPTPTQIPKWIENSHEKRTQGEITAAINARLAFRALRRALGFTQPELALKLGVSLASIQGSESGYRPVSRDLARLIQTKFGVFASSVTGYTKQPVTLLGEKVTPESVERVFAGTPRKVSEIEIAQFTKPLTALLEAAAQAGRLRVFGATYKDSLVELKRALDLGESLQAVLSPAPSALKKLQPREITRKQLRESPELAKALEQLGVIDDPSKPEHEVLTTIVPPASPTPASEPWFSAGPWFPNWNDFVDGDGNIHWAESQESDAATN